MGPETAIVPRGWESRLIAVKNPNTHGATGWCLEVHDLVLSKYATGREKDHEFVIAAIRHGLAQRDELLRRLSDLPVDDESRAGIAALILRDSGANPT